MMRKAKGFTLVEMLIVIAVIGVLAVAVLSAINPVEQMRKARDTRRKSNAAELLNAIERYYATHEEHSAALLLAAVDATDCVTVTAGDVIESDDLADFVTENELKQEFIDRVTDTSGDNHLYVGINQSTDLAAVCFAIESEANIAKYTDVGTICDDGATPPGEYYVCVPE